MIFDSKVAKEKFLIDQIATLQKTIIIMATDLSFKNYRLFYDYLNFFCRCFGLF